MHSPMSPVEKRKTICVFCGSSMGHDEAFGAAARELGRLIAENRYLLVCGGGGAGLLGELARSARRANGQVVAIIPDFLHRRVVPLTEATETIVTESMHERKRRMFELADAFVALPGGIGTIEETVEMLTWAQLELHAKPIILINAQNYWDPLIGLFRTAINAGFAMARILEPLHIVSRADEAMNLLPLLLDGNPNTIHLD